MKESDIALLKELEQKSQLSEKEFAQYEVLKRAYEAIPVIEQFRKNQKAPYAEKVSRAYNLAWEFFHTVNGKCYVSVGGLDSITLFLFLRSIGIDVPAISVSSLEDKSIQRVHKALGIIPLKPEKSKVEVIREFGWPVISKEIAGKIQHLQHPTEKNATIRHAIITGETGKQGGYRTGSRMKLPDKWLRLFGGYENDNEGVDYEKPDFLVSDRCCYYLKEKPCNDYAKTTGRFPYMGLMASEGGRREKALMLHGCNYISEWTKRSAPFATFMRNDLLRLSLEMEEWYQEHWTEFRPVTIEEDGTYTYGEPIHLERILPAIYGEIRKDEDGNYYTTEAQRTGCSMCGFGCHMEKRPHRFDLLWKRNQKEWDLWMHHVVQRDDGSWYGWGYVLDYIGVEWRNPESAIVEKIEQMTMEELEKLVAV